MRKLFAFFRRFQIFLLFAALQFIALSTYFTYLSFPRSQYLTTTNKVSGSLWKAQNELTKYLHLSENNRSLMQSNKYLREKLPENFIRLDYGKVEINDTLYKQQYTYTPATVVNSTVDKSNNYITINIGRIQGIKRGMGVFCDDGIVGVIFHVSEHYSLVKSILSQNPNIDVMLENDGSIGLLKWETKNPRIGNLTGISNDQPVKKWTKVLTRGGGGIFPKGLMVGKVSSIRPIEGRAQWDVHVLLSTQFRKLQHVYVLRNKLKTEKDRLESTIPRELENE